MDTELGDKLEMRVGIKESNITPNFLLRVCHPKNLMMPYKERKVRKEVHLREEKRTRVWFSTN